MLKPTAIVLAFALCAAPVLVTPARAQQTDAQRRAYQAGYQNGVNDRNQNKPLNLKTGNWKGENLISYQRGYRDGYERGARGNYGRADDDDRRDYGRRDNDDRGAYGTAGVYQTDAQRRAYQAGYQNGFNDRNQNKPLNLTTGNWKGENLTSYQRGYREGYERGARGDYRRPDDDDRGDYGRRDDDDRGAYGRRDNDDRGDYGRRDDDDRSPYGAAGTYHTDAEQRAYQAGYQNGVNDRNRNKPLNLRTGNWKGPNLVAYQHGYRDGYQGRDDDRRRDRDHRRRHDD